jgi:CubicO group peptidase (beta-lactamase class C family)
MKESLATANTVKMSQDRLSHIGSVLSDHIARKEVPGFVTLVARKGKLAHLQTHGHRGMEVGEPMPENAIFHVASMTKPILAVSAMMLFEEGCFDMYEPISTYLPEFKYMMVEIEPGKTVPADREITPHDLFTHTSGLSATRSSLEAFSYACLSDHMKDLSEEPLSFQPGTDWNYDSSHYVLSYLVEALAGDSLIALWQTRIFDPLGMEDTHYWLPPTEEYRRAILLRDGMSDPNMKLYYPAVAAQKQTYCTGATGLHTTAKDYWQFCQMLLNGGRLNETRLLSPKTVDWMTVNHIGNVNTGAWVPHGNQFGLGMAVVTNSADASAPFSPGTYFWGGANGTFFWIDPKEELIGIIMAQVRPYRHLKYISQFEALVYASITG